MGENGIGPKLHIASAMKAAALSSAVTAAAPAFAAAPAVCRRFLLC
jgi:hypothetical protein